MKKVLFLPMMITGFVALFGVPGCKSASGPDDNVVDETYVHERPAWSPNGLKIAFTVRVPDSAGVYVVDTTGANVRLLKSGAGVGLTWSPDSRWIAFSVSGSLFKILETGDSLTQVTTNVYDYRPAWSPDGKWIAYVNSGLHLLDVQKDTILDVLPYGEFPSWHSNSTGILLLVLDVTDQGRYYHEFQTYSMLDSSVNVQFSFFSDAVAGFSSINNAGDQIIMSLRPPDLSDLAQIVKGSIVGLTLTQLTADGGDYPSWSPDGSKIVYMRSAKGDGGLWIMNADGSGKHRLTTP